MHWGILAAVSGMGLATRNITFKLASDKVDAAMGALILSISMALVTIGFVLFQRFASSGETASFYLTPKGFALAAVAGTGVAFANIFLALTYKADGPASLVAILGIVMMIRG